jgi:hypothetical protein
MSTSSVSYVLNDLARWRNLVASFWRKLLDPYRPELYYMRGPGPKWREKHLHNTAR